MLVLGEVDLAVGGMNRRHQLQQAPLDLMGIGQERGHGRRPIEARRIELVDPKVDVHRQRRQVQDLAQQTLDHRLLFALQAIVGIGGVHEQVGDERQAIFHGHGPAISRRLASAVKPRHGSAGWRASGPLASSPAVDSR
jgi:hypothetical protein